MLDSVLGEHPCEGWLEGYLPTGRHGLFSSYEAFIRIVESMFSQHASMADDGRRPVHCTEGVGIKLIEHKHHIDRHGEDLPEILGWKWGVPG